MNIKTVTPFILVLLTGCAYRYGAGYFIANDKKLPEPEDYPMTLPTAVPVASNSPREPCAEEGVKTTKLEVVNKIDHANQTLTTTAVTETHTTPPAPCP